MNKSERLEKLALELTKGSQVTHIDVFYGDCGCEYINPKGKSYGWHLRWAEPEPGTTRHEYQQRYLGANAAQAESRIRYYLAKRGRA